MVFVKNIKFLHPFFLAKIGRENVGVDVIQRKLAFLDYENIDQKTSQNLRFSKGVSPSYWLEISNFFILSFWAK